MIVSENVYQSCTTYRVRVNKFISIACSTQNYHNKSALLSKYQAYQIDFKTSSEIQEYSVSNVYKHVLCYDDLGMQLSDYSPGLVPVFFLRFDKHFMNGNFTTLGREIFIVISDWL